MHICMCKTLTCSTNFLEFLCPSNGMPLLHHISTLSDIYLLHQTLTFQIYIPGPSIHDQYTCAICKNAYQEASQ
uniref:Uncharacterized protein n=1 Tax=Arundo donax TaxID=35708 RepID=A0A0A9GPN5_ARUDO